jgi:prepilin-type N-terminal cleavage/methylation domain-containing protein
MRKAFSLTELLAALGLIALLASFLLPAIQRARESARRTQCAGNLHEIGIALHAYEEQFGCYPLAFDVDETNGVPWRFKMFSAQSRLLPFLTYQSTYNSINFQVGASPYMANDPDSPINSTAAASHIAQFLCPSDPRHFDGPPGDNNYRINMGTIAEFLNDYSGENGPFSSVFCRRSADVTDGLAHTGFFSEKLRGDGSVAVTPETDIFFVFPDRSGLVSNVEFIQQCGTLTLPLPPHESRHGFSWLFSGTLYTWYNHVTGPNSLVPDCAKVGHNPHRGLFAARSWHFGGVNVLMGDGAVQFVQDSVDLSIWRALGTRARGDDASLSSF